MNCLSYNFDDFNSYKEYIKTLLDKHNIKIGIVTLKKILKNEY